jgi:putative membrane protein
LEVIELMGYCGGGMPAWMWIVNPLVTLLFWGGLVALIVYGVRAFTRPRDGGESADEILKRRLAAGQISQEDYERTRKVLHG